MCIDDVIQTLIDLRLAHTGIETNYKQQGVRGRRHKPNQCDDNNNTLNPTSILTIDEDRLHSIKTRLSNGDLLTKPDQHIFHSNYLRLINRR
jgi:hypothetical protein